MIRLCRKNGSFGSRVLSCGCWAAFFVINIMLLARRTLRPLSTVPLSRRCGLSSRASAILSSLDIPTTPTELPGVYDGEWKGSGDSFQSICPTTGEILAHVKSVN